MTGGSDASKSPGLGMSYLLNVCISKRKQQKIYNCKLSKVTAQRGDSGAYLPNTRFWLEQIVISPGSIELSQAGILRGGEGDLGLS